MAFACSDLFGWIEFKPGSLSIKDPPLVGWLAGWLAGWNLCSPAW